MFSPCPLLVGLTVRPPPSPPQATAAACVLLFRDASSITSSHFPTTVKHCTPSVSCTRWHCACDRVIRAALATASVVGAVVLLADGGPAGPPPPRGGGPAGGAGHEHVHDHAYFLPLAECHVDGLRGALPLASTTTLAQVRPPQPLCFTTSSHGCDVAVKQPQSAHLLLTTTYALTR